MHVKNVFRLAIIIFFIIGLLFFTGGLTGLTIAEHDGVKMPESKSFIGLGSILFAIFLLFATSKDPEDEIKRLKEDLETIASAHHWKKYSVNRDSVLQDMDLEYLENRDLSEKKTEKQKSIEYAVTGGKEISSYLPNKRRTYEDQFHEGHAAQGGRVIDVLGHIAEKGPHKGKLLHFGQPANSVYLWIVDEEGNFIVANRKDYIKDLEDMNKTKIDYHHRIHKLPHPTIARGRKVYGSGEVIIEGGRVKKFSCASGHYIDLKDIAGFNKQGKEVFLYIIRKLGWKEVEGGAEYYEKK